VVYKAKQTCKGLTAIWLRAPEVHANLVDKTMGHVIERIGTAGELAASVPDSNVFTESPHAGIALVVVNEDAVTLHLAVTE